MVWTTFSVFAAETRAVSKTAQYQTQKQLLQEYDCFIEFYKEGLTRGISGTLIPTRGGNNEVNNGRTQNAFLLPWACLKVQPNSGDGISNIRRWNPETHIERVYCGSWNIIVHLYQLQYNEDILYKIIKTIQMKKGCIVLIPLE